jgi:hypothetical protein
MRPHTAGSRVVARRSGKALDPIAIDAGASRTVGLADGKVLEKSRGDFDASTL